MKRILIVEDDQILARIYKNKFQQEQFVVDTAPDGQCALDLLASCPPDIVLLDLMLPKVNGIEVLKNIRSRSATQAIPVVVFTNAYLDSLIQDAWNAGATQCLTKANCTPKQVVELILDLIQNPPLITPTTAPPAPARAPVPSFPPPTGVPLPVFTAPVHAQSAPAPPAQVRPGPAFPAPPAISTPLPPLAPPRSGEPAEAPALGDFAAQDPDAQFQKDLRRTMAENSGPVLDRLHWLFQAVLDASDQALRRNALFDFHRKLRSLANDAAIANAPSLSKIAGAMEALAKTLHDKPVLFNASTQHTLDQSLVLLSQLLPRLARPEPPGLLHGRVLIVDSDKLTRRALVLAVTRSELEAVPLEDTALALKKLAEGPQDLVIIDTDTTDVSGSELAQQMRKLPVHRETPLILVVTQPELESRLAKLSTNHDDLIAKPIQFAELSLKCQVHILSQNLEFCG